MFESAIPEFDLQSSIHVSLALETSTIVVGRVFVVAVPYLGSSSEEILLGPLWLALHGLEFGIGERFLDLGERLVENLVDVLAELGVAIEHEHAVVLCQLPCAELCHEIVPLVLSGFDPRGGLDHVDGDDYGTVLCQTVAARLRNGRSDHNHHIVIGTRLWDVEELPDQDAGGNKVVVVLQIISLSRVDSARKQDSICQPLFAILVEASSARGIYGRRWGVLRCNRAEASFVLDGIVGRLVEAAGNDDYEDKGDYGGDDSTPIERDSHYCGTIKGKRYETKRVGKRAQKKKKDRRGGSDQLHGEERVGGGTRHDNRNEDAKLQQRIGWDAWKETAPLLRIFCSGRGLQPRVVLLISGGIIWPKESDASLKHAPSDMHWVDTLRKLLEFSPCHWKSGPLYYLLARCYRPKGGKRQLVGEMGKTRLGTHRSR